MFENTVVCGRIALGIQGEHRARKISFNDAKIWQDQFGQGKFELLHQRNGDVAPYPVILTVENNIPYWYVTSSDTAVVGEGKCELRYTVDDILIKSCTYLTDVSPSLGEGTIEPPESEKSWVDQVLEAGETALQAVESVEKAIEAAESAEQSAKDAEAFASEGNGHISDKTNPHGVTAEQVNAYTKAEIDEMLKNPSYVADVKLTGITTPTEYDETAGYILTDNSLGSGYCKFIVDIKGNVKFTCRTGDDGYGDIYIDGNKVATLSTNTDNGVSEYSYNGTINKGMVVQCNMVDIYFSEFVKQTYVADAIGDIDSALDELHNYATSLIGGEA